MTSNSRWLGVVYSIVLGAVLTLASPTWGQMVSTEVQKLTASDGAVFAAFGRAVSISGETALVTADAAQDKGAAYVFLWDGVAWSETQKLESSDGTAGDLFGKSAAMVGDFAAIAAPWDDDLGNSSGSVYIFQRTGTDWVEVDKLTASDGAAGDQFGFSLAMTDEIIAVSAPFDDDQGNDSGSTYVFRYDGVGWNEEQKLVASLAGTGDAVGWNTAADGDLLAFSTVEDGAGAVYVFRHDGLAWNEEQVLAASDGASGDWFGWGLSVDVDRIAVGAIHDDSPASDAGSAYVFSWDGMTWTEQQKIVPTVSQNFDNFGWSAVLQGDTLAVGAAGYEGGDGDGAVYLFQFDGATWNETDLWLAAVPGGGFLDNLGFSLAVDGSHVLSGAPWATGNAGDAGAAYYFQLPLLPITNFIRGDTNGDGSFAGLVDGIFILDYQFSGGATPPCLEAADADGDAALNGLVDGIYVLNHQFNGGPPPPAPYPGCGEDPDPGASLGCDGSGCP